MRSLFYALLFPLPFLVSAQEPLTFTFSTGPEGWIADFADYPVGEEAFYELAAEWTPLPPPLDPSDQAIMITGVNRSDDLFMFIKRKVEGLLPNTTYQLLFDVQFASEAPTNAIGVGGPPGEAVVMKVGATRIEPMKVDDGQGFYVMNIDKSNQSTPGTDMDTIGHVGVTDTTTVFTLISRNNFSHPFSVTTDTSGELWLIVGTESGFESTTTLYYNTITVTFNNPVGISETSGNFDCSVFPNPSRGSFFIRSSSVFHRVDLFSSAGQILHTFPTASHEMWIDVPLPAGSYVIRICNDEHILIRKILIGE